VTPSPALEHERAVLSAALLFPGRAREAALASADFQDPRLGSAWSAILSLLDEGEPVDPVTVADRSSASIETLAGLLSQAVTAESIAYHGRQVRDAAVDREVRSALDRLLRSGSRGSALVAEATEELGKVRLPEAVSGELAGVTLLRSLDRVGETMQGRIAGLRTGLSELDRQTLGIPLALVTLIAARPSQGKSALALQIATSIAARGERVDYYSLEDDRDGTARRAMAQASGVSLYKLIYGGLDGREFGRVSQAAADLHRAIGSSLWFCDDLPRDAEAFALEVERRALRSGARLIVVDYVQLLSSPELRGRSRNDELSEVSRRLKRVAKLTGAALLVCSQLSRDAERDGGSPQLWHLRDCGSLEQDSHVVIMLERPKWLAYERSGEQLPITLAHVRKNKNGATGTVGLAWDGPAVRFGDLTPDLAEEMSCAMRRRFSTTRGGKR